MTHLVYQPIDALPERIPAQSLILRTLLVLRCLRLHRPQSRRRNICSTAPRPEQLGKLRLGAPVRDCHRAVSSRIAVAICLHVPFEFGSNLRFKHGCFPRATTVWIDVHDLWLV